MSDFLTNLVMRSFSGTPAVQPMTFSTYAAPEPVDVDVDVDQPPPQTFAQKLVKPTPVVNADKYESVSKVTEAAETAQVAEATETAEVDNLFIPTIQAQTPEPRKPLVIKEKSVSPPVAETKPPRVNQRSTNAVTPPAKETGLPQQQQEKIVERTETRTEFKTEIQPASPQQPIYRTPIKTVQPSTRRLTQKQPIPISSPAQTQPSEVSPTPAPNALPAPKHDLEIVEHVIERPSVTVENTQQVTTSFTTLIPNTTAQPLPALNFKQRAKTPPRDLPADAEAQTPTTPETVINVAIGRIEVRATPATTSKRERQQHGPKVRTLDDYLQQRSRGAQ